MPIARPGVSLSLSILAERCPPAYPEYLVKELRESRQNEIQIDYENLLKNFRRRTHGFWLPHTNSIDARIVGGRLGCLQHRQYSSQTSAEIVEQASLNSASFQVIPQPTVLWDTKTAGWFVHWLCLSDGWLLAGNLRLQRDGAKTKEKLDWKVKQKPGTLDQNTLLQQTSLGKKT